MFSYLSRIVAVLLLIIGMAEFALGWAIATGMIGPYEQALARYTTHSSAGAVIDQGVQLLAIALALGTLAEIGRAVHGLKAKDDTA